MLSRVIAGWLVVAVILAGPLPVAWAQQAPPPAPVQVAPPPPPPPPPPAEEIRYERQAPGVDGYDVGAGVLTVLKVPAKLGLCVLGGAVGLALFAATLGHAVRAPARLVEEGCGGPWVVRGDDLRPYPYQSRYDRAMFPGGQ